MATKVLILGHSFNSRFHDFLRFNVRADVNLNLSLNDKVSRFSLEATQGPI
jgi:hypothetical protein